MESHDNSRTLTVPKIETRLSSAYYDACHDPDSFEIYTLPNDEFIDISRSGFFETMNDHYDILLGDYESEDIEIDLSFLLEEARKIKDRCPTLYLAASAAWKYGTGISFDL